MSKIFCYASVCRVNNAVNITVTFRSDLVLMNKTKTWYRGGGVGVLLLSPRLGSNTGLPWNSCALGRPRRHHPLGLYNRFPAKDTWCHLTNLLPTSITKKQLFLFVITFNLSSLSILWFLFNKEILNDQDYLV